MVTTRYAVLAALPLVAAVGFVGYYAMRSTKRGMKTGDSKKSEPSDDVQAKENENKVNLVRRFEERTVFKLPDRNTNAQTTTFVRAGR